MNAAQARQAGFSLPRRSVAKLVLAAWDARGDGWMGEARAKGITFGRPPLLTGEMLRETPHLITLGMGVTDAALQIGVGRSTLYRHLSDLSTMRAA